MVAMHARIDYLAVVLGVLCVIWPAKVTAQVHFEAMDVYEAVTENGFVGSADVAAMGNTQFASIGKGSALLYNPALLARIYRTELAASLSHERFKNRTEYLSTWTEDHISKTRLTGLWAVFPVPARHRDVALGLSVSRIRSFDRIFRYATSEAWLDDPTAVSGWGGGEDEDGSLWVWSFGGGVEVSHKLSIGLSIEVLDGTDSYFAFFDSTGAVDNYMYNYSQSVEDEYSGISGKLGAAYVVSNEFTLAAVLGFPTSVSVEQSIVRTEEDNEGFFDQSFDSGAYEYNLPFWLGIGGTFVWDQLRIAGDVSYTDYDQMEYDEGFRNLSRANMAVQRYYTDALNYHLGAEYRFYPHDLKLRAGFYRQKMPFRGFIVKDHPYFFTAGLGFLVDRTVNMDVALLIGSWKREDPNLGTLEKYRTYRFGLTASYRIR